MIKLYSLDNRLNERTVVTIGYFDGVHCGHKFLLNDLQKEGKENGLKTLVVTFSNHPQLLFQPDCGLRFLTLGNEKIRLLENMGFDYCLVLPFTREFAYLTSKEFMRILHESFGMEELIVGYDHHFGSDRDSSFTDYVEFGDKMGVNVVRCDAFSVSDMNVSSSKIRDFLISGEIEQANMLLGYNYTIIGRVVHGHKVGRKIGFPTANIEVSEGKLLPKNGVYAVTVEVEGQCHRGMMNIGYRPTLNNVGLSIEVYIDEFGGDIYDRMLVVEITKYIRDERKFNSLEALKKQLSLDLESIKE